MEKNPEITLNFNKRMIKSDNYGWNRDDFFIVDKKNNRKIIFKNAYLTGMLSKEIDETTMITIPVKFNRI